MPTMGIGASNMKPYKVTRKVVSIEVWTFNATSEKDAIAAMKDPEQMQWIDGCMDSSEIVEVLSYKAEEDKG